MDIDQSKINETINSLIDELNVSYSFNDIEYVPALLAFESCKNRSIDEIDELGKKAWNYRKLSINNLSKWHTFFLYYMNAFTLLIHELNA